MKEHLENESLSAYLDGELDNREKLRIEQHLQSCAVCSAARAGLASAAKSIASLGPVSMTVDEHRALRQAVLRSRPSPAAKRFGFPQWALAGTMVLIAVSALAISFLRGGPSQRDEALTEAGMPSDSSPPIFNFDEPADVDRTVEALPEIAGPKRSSAQPDQAARDQDASAKTSGAPAPANSGSAQTLEQPPPLKAMVPPGEAGGEGGIMAAPGPFSTEAGDECMHRVAATQSYQMLPLRVEEASYQDRPAWLLVYAWGPNVDAGLPADRWQTWLVDPDDCINYSGAELEAKALYRSFTGPN